MLALGVVTVLAIYLPVRHLQSFNHSAPALEMPSMKLDRVNVFWALPLVQASGFAALIWAYLGLALGLVEAGGGRRARWLALTHAARVRLHRQISLLVLGLILMHAVMTVLDAMGDNFLTALVPFMETYHPPALDAQPTSHVVAGADQMLESTPDEALASIPFDDSQDE